MAKTPKKSASNAEKTKVDEPATKPKRAAKPKNPAKSAKKGKKITGEETSPVIATARRLPNSRSREKAKNAAAEAVEQKKDPPKERTNRERKKHATRPTAEEEARILERRFLVWDLYKAGASFRAISEHLRAKGEKHASVGTVHADLKYCLNLQHSELELDVKDHVENEIAVLQDVRLTFSPVMKDAKMPYDIRLNAGSMVINTVKEIARLRNLYKPQAIRILSKEEFAAQLGLTADQLPDDEDGTDNE